MKKMTLNDLKKGKLSQNVVKNLDLLKGGLAAAEFCHPILGLSGQSWGKPGDRPIWV